MITDTMFVNGTEVTDVQKRFRRLRRMSTTTLDAFTDIPDLGVAITSEVIIQERFDRFMAG
jgi:hypothetical protein